jgi:hypothetical protein
MSAHGGLAHGGAVVGERACYPAPPDDVEAPIIASGLLHVSAVTPIAAASRMLLATPHLSEVCAGESPLLVLRPMASLSCWAGAGGVSATVVLSLRGATVAAAGPGTFTVRVGMPGEKEEAEEEVWTLEAPSSRVAGAWVRVLAAVSGCTLERPLGAGVHERWLRAARDGRLVVLRRIMAAHLQQQQPQQPEGEGGGGGSVGGDADQVTRRQLLDQRGGSGGAELTALHWAAASASRAHQRVRWTTALHSHTHTQRGGGEGKERAVGVHELTGPSLPTRCAAVPRVAAGAGCGPGRAWRGRPPRAACRIHGAGGAAAGASAWPSPAQGRQRHPARSGRGGAESALSALPCPS